MFYLNVRTDKEFTIKTANSSAICQVTFYFWLEMLFRFAFSVVVIILVNSVSTKQSLSSETTFGNDSEMSKTTIERNRQAEERINLSFPGTKWCGPGNTADGYEDLGSDEEVDKCCREHDHCDNMASGEEKHGLTNNDFFTRLHCTCDKEFKQCLRRVDSKRGNFIGNFYLNVRDRCYKEQHPIVECDEIHTK